MNSLKAKSLMHRIAQAAKVQDKSGAKETIVDHVKEIRSLTEKPDSKKEAVQAELEALERKVTQLLEIEQKLADKEKEDVLKLGLELKTIRDQLSLSEKSELGKKLDRILFLLSEIAARVESYIEVKKRHSQRSMEIEEKIKQSAAPERKDMAEIEEKIAGMEKKYSRLSKKAPDAEILDEIKNRLHNLRQQLIEKKMKQIDVRGTEAFTYKPITKPKIIMPAEQKPRHRMLFPNAGGAIQKKIFAPVLNGEQATEGGIPLDEVPIPPSENDHNFEQELMKIEAEIQSDMPPLPRKKKPGLFSRMLGKKKRRQL